MIRSTPTNLCFDLISDAVLRTTGFAKYEHETMGASLFVQKIGHYLADYHFIFSDQTRSKKLTASIDLFVNAEWPEARRLLLHLPELIK